MNVPKKSCFVINRKVIAVAILKWQNYTTTITFEVGTSVSAYRKNDKSVNKKAAPIAGTAFYI